MTNGKLDFDSNGYQPKIHLRHHQAMHLARYKMLATPHQ